MRTIEVTYHHEVEGWWAESRDLPGWSVAAPDVRGLRRLVRDSVEFTLQDEEVELLEVGDQATLPS